MAIYDREVENPMTLPRRRCVWGRDRYFWDDEDDRNYPMGDEEDDPYFDEMEYDGWTGGMD